MSIALLALLVTPATELARAEAERGPQYTYVRRPALSTGQVELSRDVSADRWNSRFCVKWTDNCMECSFGEDPAQMLCKSRPDQHCKPERVRCLDIDAAAPLFCAGIGEECGGIAWIFDHEGRLVSATAGFCPTEHHRRRPLDYACITYAQVVADECRRGWAFGRCVARIRKPARLYRQYWRRLIEASEQMP